MRLKRAAASALTALLLLSGCGQKLTEGEVYEKNFTEKGFPIHMVEARK